MNAAGFFSLLTERYITSEKDFDEFGCLKGCFVTKKSQVRVQQVPMLLAFRLLINRNELPSNNKLQVDG